MAICVQMTTTKLITHSTPNRPWAQLIETDLEARNHGCLVAEKDLPTTEQEFVR